MPAQRTHALRTSDDDFTLGQHLTFAGTIHDFQDSKSASTGTEPGGYDTLYVILAIKVRVVYDAHRRLRVLQRPDPNPAAAITLTNDSGKKWYFFQTCDSKRAPNFHF